ncbi:response regulator [Noviherbaspirillum sp. 17J57-3]|uniref:histidine kinase n=2 Tax=Noviherbaspirillum galbum TaxID=2709383 RepID=A0A6B3SFB4_9BURK|nr:response regulator [Noviherbaspirillum galbum]
MLDQSPKDDATLASLRREAVNFAALGFSGVRIANAADETIVAGGAMELPGAPMAVRLTQAPGKAMLIWKDGFLFHQEHDIVDKERHLGKIVLERPLLLFHELMEQAQRISASSDLVLCARDADDVACFPSRHDPKAVRYPMFNARGEASGPVARALAGQSGSARIRDARGAQVLAGYFPLPNRQLAVMEKIDASELYLPLRERFPWLVGAVLLFIAAGTLLLRRWVQPLAGRISAQRERMHAILDNTNDAFLSITAGGVISDWNREAQRMFGWPASEAIGRNFVELLIPPPERKARSLDLQRFLADETEVRPAPRLEIMVVDRAGNAMPAELSAAPFRDGRSVALGIFLRDLRPSRDAARELEEARLALMQAQKLDAVGKLTGGIAHDFNNVLQVLKGSLQLIQLENENRQQVQQRATTAMGAVDRGARLSSQLLAFARKQPLRPAVTNLGRMLRDMNDLLQRAAGETIAMETIIAAGLWNTLVDRHQLEQVVLNLVINARDAMDGQGRITLQASNAELDQADLPPAAGLKAGQYIMLAISDTGCGMSPGVADRAFEPFFTTKPEGKGTGLGLSMAYGFVKQSGGHIAIRSQPGQGTTVTIYLPRTRDEEDRIVAPRLERVVGGSETILVVEDDLGVQATAVQMLTQLGYRVLKADQAEAAMAIVESGAKVDLLFTDVVMPGALRSPELARRALALLPGLKVLYTSGYTENAIVQGGRLNPGVHLLTKPYQREDLARKLRELLDPALSEVFQGAPESIHNTECKSMRDVPESAYDPDASPHQAPVRRIVFVEDNDDFRGMAAEMLCILGCEVESFASAEAALDVLRNGGFDTLITDITLNGMSGIELAGTASSLHPELKIILASGGDAPASDAAGFKYESLNKPFLLQDLADMLQRTAPAEA